MHAFVFLRKKFHGPNQTRQDCKSFCGYRSPQQNDKKAEQQIRFRTFLVLEVEATALHFHQACRHGRHLPPPHRGPSVSADSAATPSPASAGRLRGPRIPSTNRCRRPPWLQVRYPTYHYRTPRYRWDWLEKFLAFLCFSCCSLPR